MMDTKPIWIDGYYESHAEAAGAVKEVFIGEWPEIVPLQALTLDQIEAWLKECRTWRDKYNDDNRPVFDDLLAQVQAWKEGA
jgi:hypothetical protein